MTVMRSSSAALALAGSNTSPQPIVCGIDGNVDAGESGRLVFSYTVSGNMHRVRVPLSTAPQHVDGLWKHTCFEAFFGVKDSAAYCEFNFSPSRQWAAYLFRGYRERVDVEIDGLAPEISVEETPDGLTLTAAVRIDHLTGYPPGAALRIGLSAVIEATDGTLSYWALKHPSDQPDFHHPDSFVLEVALPERSV